MGSGHPDGDVAVSKLTESKVRELLERKPESHYECEDPWYSCPQQSECVNDDRRGDPCDCGADERNKLHDEIIRPLCESWLRSQSGGGAGEKADREVSGDEFDYSVNAWRKPTNRRKAQRRVHIRGAEEPSSLNGPFRRRPLTDRRKAARGKPSLSEWIDVAILALDGAWRAGYSPSEIISALVAKQTKNESRQWPDWRTAPTDKAIEHVRAAAPATNLPEQPKQTQHDRPTALTGGWRMTWDCAIGTPDEDHDWEYVRDWAGDPGVINGTYDINYRRCLQCGKEDDWDGRTAEEDPDFERTFGSRIGGMVRARRSRFARLARGRRRCQQCEVLFNTIRGKEQHQRITGHNDNGN